MNGKMGAPAGEGGIHSISASVGPSSEMVGIVAKVPLSTRPNEPIRAGPANRDSFRDDGWFRTDDLGYFADAANGLISGRKKEIINRGGKKYFPREIEDILYEHPAFLQIAIVGIPGEGLGERNCLCAVLKPGCSVALNEVVALLTGARWRSADPLYANRRWCSRSCTCDPSAMRTQKF
jgi:acyl-CoA synthetase (AMP-forming)/AMP-acid ligase II